MVVSEGCGPDPVYLATMGRPVVVAVVAVSVVAAAVPAQLVELSPHLSGQLNLQP